MWKVNDTEFMPLKNEGDKQKQWGKKSIVTLWDFKLQQTENHDIKLLSKILFVDQL